MNRGRQYLKPEEIYKKSFNIIKREFGVYNCPEKEMLIRTRIAHTTTDVEFAKSFIFHKDAIESGIKAINENKNIFTDVSMVASGIRARLNKNFNGKLLCFLYDDDISENAKNRGTTKSAVAMTKGAPFYKDGIVAIGNAPTALFELIDMVKNGTAAPALIVGVPVGFVGAEDSKRELSELRIPYITNIDRKGGSPIAAAIVNGIITLAGKDQY